MRFDRAILSVFTSENTENLEPNFDLKYLSTSSYKTKQVTMTTGQVLALHTAVVLTLCARVQPFLRIRYCTEYLVEAIIELKQNMRRFCV